MQNIMKYLALYFITIFTSIYSVEYQKIFDFNGSNGQFPHYNSAFTLTGSKLFGMTTTGGVNEIFLKKLKIFEKLFFIIYGHG
jgi:hypothetical protein